MRVRKGSYWSGIPIAIKSLGQGLLLTWKHLRRSVHSQRPVAIDSPTYFDKRTGIATIQYPHEVLPVPDTGRYRLHNEIDDCIVCDKCVKVCPVDCITIDPIKSAEEFGKTSDGTPKRIYAAKFDIDMGKCCFCGLCTTVCPTECLTMTKVYDFSVYDIREHNYAFADMLAEEIDQKRRAYDEAQKAKELAKAATQSVQSAGTSEPEVAKPTRPVFKPRIKPPPSSES